MSAEAIVDHYRVELKAPTDMWEHMPTINKYAHLCHRIVEFGVYDCTSTWGLLSGYPRWMRSYDIARRPEVNQVEAAVADTNIDFKFVLMSSLDAPQDETDLLFIDSLHTYNQLAAELARHAPSVTKFIMMHDTTTFGEVDQNGKRPGLWKAVEDFLASNSIWRVCERHTNCHGLTVLERHG
jgi:hypothetical protein